MNIIIIIIILLVLQSYRGSQVLARLAPIAVRLVSGPKSLVSKDIRHNT